MRGYRTLDQIYIEKEGKKSTKLRTCLGRVILCLPGGYAAVVKQEERTKDNCITVWLITGSLIIQ